MIWKGSSFPLSFTELSKEVAGVFFSNH